MIMTGFSKQKLYKLINPNYQRDKKNTYQISYANFGPNGQLDKHLALLSSEGNSYRQRRILSNDKKKKIIISDGSFRFNIPNQLDIQMISALFDEFEVILWSEESERNIQTSKPISHGEEFWNKCPLELKSATEEQVLRQLSNQGVSTEDYVVLDYSKYRTLTNQFVEKKDEKEPAQLDLRTVAEWVNPLNLISSEKLTGLKLPAKENFTHEIPAEIEDKIILDDRQKLGIESVAYPTKKLKFKNYKHRTIQMTAGTTDSLLIEDCNALEIVDFSVNPLKEITLINCPTLKKFTYCGDQIEKIVIHNVTASADFSTRFFDCKQLKHLELIDAPTNTISNINFENVPRYRAKCERVSYLKTLKFQTGNPIILDLKKSKTLQVLHITPLNKKAILIENLKDATNIIDLKINQDDLANLDEIYTLEKLETLELCGSTAINLQHFQTITRLKISNALNLEEFKIEELEHLEELEIDGCLNTHLVLPILKKCKKLKKLTIRCVKPCLLDLTHFPQLESLTVDRSYNLDINPHPSHSLHFLKITRLLNVKPYEPLFKQVETLELIDLQTPDLFFDFPTKIRNLKIRKEDVFSEDIDIQLNLAAFPHLETFYLDDNLEKNLDFTPCPKLKIFEYDLWSQNAGRTYNFTHCRNLQKISLRLCEGTDIDLSNQPNLRSANFRLENGESAGAEGNSISLANCPQLSQLDIHDLNEGLPEETLTWLKEEMAAGVNLDLTNTSGLVELGLNRSSKVNIKNLENCINLRKANIQILNPTTLIPQIPNTCQLTISEVQSYESKISRETKVSNNASAVTENQQLLNQLWETKQTSVSCLSDSMLINDWNIDDQTARSNEIVEMTGHFNVSLHGTKKVETDEQRIRIIDEIIYDEKTENITLGTQYNPDHLKLITLDIPCFSEADYCQSINSSKINLNQGVGLFTGTVGDGFYPLPTDTTMEQGQPFIVYSNPPNSIDVYWHTEHQAYYFCKQPTAPEQVEIAYVYQKNPSYLANTDLGEIEVRDSKSLLPTKLIERLESFFSGLPPKHPLNFIKQTELSILEKIKQLQTYCNFNDIALSRKTISAVDTLLTIIYEQKGKCRHASKAFMILARYLGVPVRALKAGDDHAVCEIPYLDKNGAIVCKKWRKCDLGGSPMQKLIKPEFRTQNLTRAQQIQRHVDEKKTTPAKEINMSPLEKTYYDYLKHFVEKKPVDSILNVLAGHCELAPLIEIKEDQCAFQISKQILTQLSEQKSIDTNSQYLFINEPKELDEYLHATQFKNNQKQKVAGPLKTIIDPNGKGGVILINWSNFSAAQIASYKSMLDAKPTLCGYPIGEKTSIIGLIKPSTVTSSAFKSRCQGYQLTSKFFSSLPETNEEKKENNLPYEIDLFHRLDWREQLLGKIHFCDNHIQLNDDSPLFAAVTAGKKLKIINPPNDPDFDNLIKRIRSEGKFLFNGEMKLIPPDMIQFAERDHPIQLDQVKVYNPSEIKALDPSKIIYLGLHNLHECFETLLIKNHRATTLPYGFLTHTQQFYLTESITKSDWQLILHTIEILNKTAETPKQYEFILAPGVRIEDVKHNDIDRPQVVPDPHATTIFTNDPDHYCNVQLSSENSPFILHITPDTGFHDLIYKSSWQVGDDHAISFNFEEKNILTALRKGLKVILSGAISPELYRQLLPMLSTEHPHLLVNGECISLKPGQLVVVAPFASKEALPLLAFHEKQYSTLDYKQHLSEEDQKYLPTINQFYSYATELSHNWAGRPPLPNLTFSRLKLFIHNLKCSNLEHKEGDILHKNNPIKGLFLYDYIKGSDDYCYLNVIGKLLFYSSHEKENCRIEKIINLISQPQKNIWKILNCFNGSALVTLFKTRVLTDLIIKTPNGPDLTPSAKQILFNHLKKLPAEHKKPPKVSHIVKRQKQLSQLLQDKHKPLIFLKGLPGVGKTFTTQQISDQFTFYQGDKRILESLQQDYQAELEGKKTQEINTSKTIVHVLDEANMFKPGMWDHLRNFMSRHPNQKILITGNPEYYAGRYFHSIFQEYGETIYFKMPDEEFLEHEVLNKILAPSKLESQSKQILYAFYLIQQMNPQFSFSHRDLENAANRLILLHQQKVPLPTFEACVEEFSLTIQDITLRQKFINHLAKQFTINVAPEEKASDLLELSVPEKKSKEAKTVLIPPEKFYIVKAVENALSLRDKALKSSHPLAYKQGVMLEGEPGLGKSTLFEAILIKYNSNPENKPIPYSVISAGDQHAHTTLLNAFHRGEIVILDELNVDPTLELLLNQLLTGKDLDGRTAAKPGFMVLTSQNYSFEKGCNGNSQAIRNRLHWIHVNRNKNESNIAIAQRKFGIFKPPLEAHDAATAFCSAFQRIQKEFPEKVNSRTFFTGLADPELVRVSTSAA